MGGTKTILLTLLLLIITSFAAVAFEFNGTVKDITGNNLNNSVINITVRSMTDFSVVGYNFTTTNASGWFNLSVSENAQWLYEPKITWKNSTSGAVEFIGQSLPAFPQQMVQGVAGTTFYLREAGTINITAINSTGSAVVFNYQLKDQKLGYSIAANFDSYVSNVVISVPRDRNYSLMIYPNQSMPVSFNWNNFSSANSYNLSDISRYNVTTKTLHYQFNTSMTMKRVSGYFNYTGITGWDEFVVLAYLLEPGDMVSVEYGVLPNNLSAETNSTDVFNLSSGFYNISLPGTVETSSVILFATAINGSQNIGAVRNISLSTNSPAETTNFNFTNAAGLFGSFSNVSPTSLSGPPKNFTLSKQNFSILNSSNQTLTNINGHIEVTVDYSSIGAKEFTWMTSISQGSASNFLVPLLNNSGIKELNAFVGGGDYAPVRKSYTAAQLANPVNITLSSFRPGDVDGASLNGLKIALLTSNSTCDIPNPATGCFLGGSDEGEEFGVEGGFDPMKSIMGGGKLSFRMGLLSSGIIVHYNNVDLLASGPPDALFDDSATTDSSSGFSSAMRFGSGGPTIYDYVLISIPYTETAGSGLDDSQPVNISIPLFYDDDWNVIWNASANGTNPTQLAGNYSHYAAKQTEWGHLLNQSTCGSNQSAINFTHPCYIDTTNNRVWVRLPHFSGTGPSVSGSTTAAAPAASSSSSSSSGGSGGGAVAAPADLLQGEANTITLEKPTEAETNPVEVKLKEKGKVSFSITSSSATSEEEHSITVENLINSGRANLTVASNPQTFELNTGESKEVDMDDDGQPDLKVTLDSIKWFQRYAEITLELLTTGTEESETTSATDSAEEINSEEEVEQTTAKEEEQKESSSLPLVVAIIVVLGVIAFVYLRKKF